MAFFYMWRLPGNRVFKTRFNHLKKKKFYTWRLPSLFFFFFFCFSLPLSLGSSSPSMLFLFDDLPRQSHHKPRTLQGCLGPSRMIASPALQDRLTRAIASEYEWVGFVKSNLGCGWVSAALSGFMVIGMS